MARQTIERTRGCTPNYVHISQKLLPRLCEALSNQCEDLEVYTK